LSHWALIRRAVSEAEKKHGRYLTLPELEKVHDEAASGHQETYVGELSALEVRAMKRIWPGMQLEFKLGVHRG